MFDPYYKWLGIRPEHQPPDHYRLLGLERFESDRDVIQAAGERQMAHVQSYKIGPQSELSQKILNEIARAKVCLLNPASKAEYDAALLAAAAPIAPPPAANQPAIRPAVPPVLAPDTIALSESPRGSDSSARLRTQRKPKRKIQTLPLLVIVVCVAILLGAVASTFLFDFSGAATRPQAIAPPQPVVKPPAASRRPPPGEGDRSMESSTATNLPQPTKRSDRARSPSIPDGDPRHPIPSGEQIQEARSKLTVQGKLTPTVTLDAARNATHPWTRYALLQMTIELAQRADRESWTEAKTCALEAARLLVAEFQLPKDFDVAISSQFERQPFKTRATARDLLAGKPSGKPLSSPPPATGLDAAKPTELDPHVLIIDAPLIDLTKNQTEVKFKPLVSVDPQKLVLTGVDVTGNPVVRQYPESGRVELGTSMRVVLRDEPPRAGLEISLHGTDELYLRIKPMIQDPDDAFYPWTESGIRTVRGKVNRSIKNVNRRIEGADQLVSNLTERSRIIKDSSATAAHRAALKTAEQDLALLNNELQKFEQFQFDLGKLSALTHEIDRKARLSFRIVQHSDGEEVPVVESSR